MHARTVIACLVLGLALATNATHGAGRSILDLYNSLPSKTLGSQKYHITEKGGDHLTRSVADYELSVTVDERNGYFALEDPGTGGGFVRQELALFLDAQKREFLGVNVSVGDGISVNTRCEFFRCDGARFVNVTANVLPKVHAGLFLEKKLDLEYFRKHIMSPFYVQYALPRYGTTVKAELRYGYVEQCARHSSDAALKARCVEFVDSVRYTSIQLPWDRKKAAFSIGAKE